MATISLSLGIDSSGEIDSACMKIFLERERVHVLDEKSIPASKIEVS